MRRMWLVISCLFINSLLAQNQIKVMAADRGWTLGKKTLHPNDSLSDIADLAGAADSSVLVLDCGPSGYYSYNCEGKQCNHVPACSAEVKGVTVKSLNPPRGWREKGTEMLLALSRHESKGALTLGVRGGGNPSEAVVLQTTQGVHWGPALNRVLEGRYCFRLSSLPSGPVKNFTLDWDRSVESEGIANVPGLAPGVYALDKGTLRSTGMCEFDPDAASAWVVIAPEADFKRISGEWKDSAAWFKQIEDSGSEPAVIVTAHHAVLGYLAEPLGKR